MASLAVRAAAAASAATAGFAAPSRRGTARIAAAAPVSAAVGEESAPPAMPPYEDGTIRVTRRALLPPPPPASWNALGSRKKKRRQAAAVQDYRPPPKATEYRTESFDVSYRIYRPDMMKSTEKAPLLVLHGGPSLPSEYLYPLAARIPDGRAVVFYDQIGCGRSSVPKDFDLYGIPQSVDDLQVLVQRLGLGRFHLLGHSYGGALAYEYVKRVQERGEDDGDEADYAAKESPGKERSGLRRPLSVVLSNASTSMRLSDEERTRLLHVVRSDMKQNPRAVEYLGRNPHEVFFRRNQCRTEGGMPPALQSAFRHIGGVWAGTEVVMDYVAMPPSSSSSSPSSAGAPSTAGGHGFPPALIIRGEHDFVTKKCTEGWADLFGADNVRERVLGGCAHYCHFEEPDLYGTVVDSYCAEHDGDRLLT